MLMVFHKHAAIVFIKQIFLKFKFLIFQTEKMKHPKIPGKNNHIVDYIQWISSFLTPES